MGKYMVYWFDEEKNVVKRQIITALNDEEAQQKANERLSYNSFYSFELEEIFGY